MKDLEIRGVVIRGSQKAQTLGFPTANFLLEIPNKEIAGVWAGIAWFGNEKGFSRYDFQAVCSISTNGKLAEMHLFDTKFDMYDRTINFKLVKFIGPRTSLRDDIFKASRCSECQNCLLQDYGYSNWTVEGTTSICQKEKRGDFDCSEKGFDFLAIGCDSFFKGEPDTKSVEDD